MDRRRFLQLAGCTAGAGAFVAFKSARNLYARQQLERSLHQHADGVLSGKSRQELESLPRQARDEIETWFHGPCLNADTFAQAISSERFLDQIARCQSREQQQELFLSAFLANVVSETQILDRIELIAEEIGHNLDFNWEESCQTLSSQWNLQISQFGEALPHRLSETLTPQIRTELKACVTLAQAESQRPTLLQTTRNIGKSALLLLPVMSRGAWSLPAFVLISLLHLADYFLARIDNVTGRIRREISVRLSDLAKRIGVEFETDVRASVVRLHEWQKKVVHTAAVEYAEQTVPLLKLTTWS